MNVVILKSKLDALAIAIGIKAGKRVPQTLDELVETVEGIETPHLQSKSVSPAATAVTVEPDEGYNGLSEVEVKAPALQSRIVNKSSSGTTTYTPMSGYIGLSSIAVDVNALPLPTSTSSYSSGTSKATIPAQTYTRYLNIPKGYNDTSSYYTLSAMPSMTLPTSTSTTSSGTRKARVGTREGTGYRYINIPTGYNGSAAYYEIYDVSPEYIGSGVPRYQGGVSGQPTLYAELTLPAASEWDTDGANSCTVQLPSHATVTSGSKKFLVTISGMPGLGTGYEANDGNLQGVAYYGDFEVEPGFNCTLDAYADEFYIVTGLVEYGGSGILAGETVRIEVFA